MKEYCLGCGRPIERSLSGASFYCRVDGRYFEVGSFSGNTYKSLRDAETTLAFSTDKRLYVDKEGHSILGVIFWEIYQKYPHYKFEGAALKKAFLSLRDGDTISTLLTRIAPALTTIRGLSIDPESGMFFNQDGVYSKIRPGEEPGSTSDKNVLELINLATTYNVSIRNIEVNILRVFQPGDTIEAYQRYYPLKPPKRPQMVATIHDKHQFGSSKVREFCRSKVGHVSFQTDGKGKDCYKVFYDMLKPEECEGDTDWREEYVAKHLSDFTRMAMIDADAYRAKNSLGEKVNSYRFRCSSYGVSTQENKLYFRIEARNI